MGGAVAGIGEALRSTRERRGLSIDQVAQDTRISPRFLEALEAEQFDELPAPVYVRGFLRSYASYLRLDAQPLLDRLIGGDLAAPGASEGYVGVNGNGRNGTRRTDPFQRGGVIAPPPPVARQDQPAPPAPEEGEQDEGWAPEPLAPFSPPPADHGYIPGSDLMEAPEYAEPEPIFRQRNAGILTERAVQPGEPGIPRKVIVFGGAVVALLGFLLLAVFLTRGGGDDSNKAGVGAVETPGLTPGTVIPYGTRSPTAGAATSPTVVGTLAPGGDATAAASATAASTTPAGTATSRATTAATVATRHANSCNHSHCSADSYAKPVADSNADTNPNNPAGESSVRRMHADERFLRLRRATLPRDLLRPAGLPPELQLVGGRQPQFRGAPRRLERIRWATEQRPDHQCRPVALRDSVARS